MRIDNRKLGTALVVGILGTTAQFAMAQDGLTVATYGGEWGAAMQDCILTPFSEATGIAVTPEPGVSGVTLSKLQQQKDSPVIDVAWMDGGVSELASAAGVVDTIDPARVPNIAGMVDEGVYKRKDGTIFALGTGYYSLGIGYNTQDVETPPTSWLDLWNPEFARAVTFPSPSNAMGVPFVVQIAKMTGGDARNIEPGLEKLKSLDVAAYFETAGSATNLFQSGEVIAGAHYASSIFAMADQGLPMAFVVPKEGAIGGDIRLHLVANTPNKENAEKLIDFAVGKQPATCMAERLFVGPSTKDLDLSDATKAKLPWGADGSVANLVLPDWDAINEERAAIIEAFNKTVAN